MLYPIAQIAHQHNAQLDQGRRMFLYQALLGWSGSVTKPPVFPSLAVFQRFARSHPCRKLFSYLGVAAVDLFGDRSTLAP